jgi:8-oxo-dGTP diphosphatase
MGMYKIEFHDFFTAAFSVDCIIFGYEAGQIKALLIKRAMEPYENFWAIPGDLVYPDEDLPLAAERILKELTGLDHIQMHQSQSFGHPKRHPQGRVITIAHFALVRIEDFQVKASSWADDISWVPLNEVPTLAFDHNHILESTYDILKQKLQNEPVCFDLLPERFTLNEFQQLYEFAFEQEMDKANFRKKIKYIPLVALNEKQKNVKHRPAKLFSFDQEAYQQRLLANEYSFKM